MLAVDYMNFFPGRVGVPKSKVSGYQTFEGPDPAEWTSKEYAICHVDIRGVANSGGDIQ